MRIETKCVQEGYKPQNGEPRAVPIAQSVTFKYDSSEFVGDLFDLKADGFFYTRLANPTLDAVEKKIAALEGGVGALLTSTGQAASFLAVMNICKAGDHVLAAATIYGGTYNLFDVTMRKMGIDFTFVDPELSEQELSGYIKENTRVVFGETLANPALNVLDIEKFAKVAHKAGVPLLIDNTFPTPVLCRPFEFGADIVIHSTTKYMEGHATTMGGAIVDSGKFNWANGKFPEFTEPDESYHGVVYTEKFGNAAYITKARVQLMRDLGTTQAPINAFILNIGLESLALRIERHSQNALAVAQFLEQDDRVKWVNYPGLTSSKYYSLAQKYLPNGVSGVLSFGIKGGREAAIKFIDSLKLASLCVHVADTRTMALHPASSTHRQMNDKALEECGITPDLIRISVGIEHIDDILEDVRQALDAASIN